MAPNQRIAGEAPQNPKRSASKMQTEAKSHPARGRLNRNVQNKLGDTLRAMFDEIVQEGVPDRFAKLLEQIEVRNKTAEEGAAERIESGRVGGIAPSGQAATENFPKTNDKGSR